MSPDDLHFLVTRLNSISGQLDNHASGVEELSSLRASMLAQQCTELHDRIRELYEAQKKS